MLVPPLKRGDIVYEYCHTWSNMYLITAVHDHGAVSCQVIQSDMNIQRIGHTFETDFSGIASGSLSFIILRNGEEIFKVRT